MKCKFAWAAGITGLVLASAVTFKMITGECPLGCLMKHVNGTPAAEAKADPKPSN
jgi:hypothetical protein